MDRIELAQYIEEVYHADAEFPWADLPTYAVFRHANNKKWFALIMDVPRHSLGLPGEGTLPAVNLKCEPLMIGSLRQEAGIYPAYHMNKEHWLTVALDGSADDERLKLLLDISYDLTARKPRKRPAKKVPAE